MILKFETIDLNDGTLELKIIKDFFVFIFFSRIQIKVYQLNVKLIEEKLLNLGIIHRKSKI